MHHHRRRGLAARTLLSVVAMALLAACAIRIEPPQDTRLIAELEALALDTQTLFSGRGFAPQALAEREAIYAGLASRAAAIRLLAEARPAPSGPVSDRIRAATLQSEDRIIGLIGHASGGVGEGEGRRDLSNATAAFMTDYLGSLERLRSRDRAATGGLPDAVSVIARLALEDALRDALFYERTILNRSR